MENIDSALIKAGEKSFSIEGQDTLRWVLMDYSDLIVHVFDEPLRVFYALDRLWGDAPRVAIGDLSEERRKRKSAAPIRKAGGQPARKGRAG
jgi:ribosome-associated protein